MAAQVAGESAALGALGGVLGVLLGFGLAALLLEPMSQTLSDHYFDSAVERVGFSPALAAAGLVLAVLLVDHDRWVGTDPRRRRLR